MRYTVNGITTVYVAGVYEYQSGATTLYYEGNAIQRNGYASDNGVFYLLQDHLKSSSALITQSGVVNSRNYFHPFGGNRGGTAFSELTTKRFTGQYHEASLPGGEGLSYYGARWYDAKLGRFVTPDSIVPGPANPQAFNRYGYVLNSPTNRIDPTGHYDVKPGDDPWWKHLRQGSTTIYLPLIASRNPRSIRDLAFSRPTIPNKPVSARYAFPSYSSQTDRVLTSNEPQDWKGNARKGIAIAKAITKRYWGCALGGNCAFSTEDWTASLDLSGFASPIGVAGRITGSIAVDHEGGIGFVGSIGGGGSTPIVSAGPGVSVTNAPNIHKLKGWSVQAGGCLKVAVGGCGELVVFKDDQTQQQYYGLSVSGVGEIPTGIPGSIHGTFERSSVGGVNLIDLIYYPIEYLLQEE